MQLGRLEIRHFRNLIHVDIPLSPGVNVFVGENGAGKTALLEAVFLLGRGKSFRSNRASSYVTHGEKETVVRGELLGSAHRSVAILRGSGGRGVAKVDNIVETRLSRVASLLPLQVMLPDVADLVFGGPSLRRAALDWGLFHVEHPNHSILRSYQRVLRQRNGWLRSGGGEIDPWLEGLQSAALELHRLRESYFEELQQEFSKTLAMVSEAVSDIKASYRPGWDTAIGLEKVLVDNHEREVKLGATQSGPHRADVEFLLEGRVAAGVLSRGQGKLLASAFMLAQARILNLKRGLRSVFLIDDMGAELDQRHAERFLRALNEIGCQVLATATKQTWIGELDRGKVFHVKQGVITGE